MLRRLKSDRRVHLNHSSYCSRDASTHPNATIIFHARASSLEPTVTADTNFNCAWMRHLLANITVRVATQGLAETGSDLAVAVGGRHREGNHRYVAAGHVVQQTVKVAAQRLLDKITEQLDVSSAVHQGAVSSEDLQNIPLGHRSFANNAYLHTGHQSR